MGRVVEVRPDLAEVVLRVIAPAGEPAAILEALQAEDRPAFAGSALAVSGAYLMNPKVCHLRGLSANAPKSNPALVDEADYYLRDDILGPVRARGPIYRRTPDPPRDADPPLGARPGSPGLPGG
jgi:hypothetical protein